MTSRRPGFVTAARPLVASIVMFSGLLAVATPARAVQFCNLTPIIGDNGTAVPLKSNPYPSSIAVSGLIGTVTDVNVSLLDFTTRGDNNVPPQHWAEDTDVLLVAPSGANVVAMSDAGGDNDMSSGPVSNADITLDDQAANQLPADTHLTSGTFRAVDDDDDANETLPIDMFPAPAPSPSGSAALLVFNGTNPNGTWRFYAVDDTGQAANDFNGGWCVDILTTGEAPGPTLAVGDVKITEGDGSFRSYFPVVLSAPKSSTVTVNFATTDSSAVQPGDYAARNGTLTFAPGQVYKVVDVLIKGDTLDEATNEVFTVRLSAPVNATIADGVGVGTIHDDDPQSGIKITISDVFGREGNSGTQARDFTVSLSRPASTTVTVDYATGNGTATQPSDYVARTGKLTFNPGDVSKVVRVSTKADTLVEANETLFVRLSRAMGGAVIADSTGVGSLINDD